MDNEDLKMPEGLDKDGESAYRTVVEYLEKHKLLFTGGCRVFYSPEEWKERGEQYGRESKLIVVYDGAEARYCFSMDACYEHEDFVQELIDSGLKVAKRNRYALYEDMQAELSKIGLFFEECTGWYSAVYKI
jgi:hypothetical protein